MSAPKLIRIEKLCSSGSEGHLAGDAVFNNQRRYRFVSYNCKVKRLMQYSDNQPETHADYVREWNLEPPANLARQISVAIAPVLDAEIAKGIEREAKRDEQDAKERAQLAAEERIRKAAPELLSACKDAALCLEMIRSDYTSLHAERDGTPAQQQQARAFYASEINKQAERVDLLLESLTATILKAEGVPTKAPSAKNCTHLTMIRSGKSYVWKCANCGYDYEDKPLEDVEDGR